MPYPPRQGQGPRIVFITGTDTGVGKTLLTALLLCHLRQAGCKALAIKPFCSGSRADARLLHTLQEGDLSLDEVNPLYFAEPVAPLVAARKDRRSIPLAAVLKHIQQVATSLPRESTNPSIHQSTKPPPTLLIEGSGGLLVPLGESYTVCDLIARLGCETIVVARNKLGTINHSLLTVRCLQAVGIQRVKAVLMDGARHDRSAGSNRRILSELLAPIPLHFVPFLGSNCRASAALNDHACRLRRGLERLAKAGPKR
jgi:dethiobiotin synthetase